MDILSLSSVFMVEPLVVLEVKTLNFYFQGTWTMLEYPIAIPLSMSSSGAYVPTMRPAR